MAINSQAARRRLAPGRIAPCCRATLVQPSRPTTTTSRSVKAGKLDIDYTAFRMAYAASPKYEPLRRRPRAWSSQMKKAFTADDCPERWRTQRRCSTVNFVQIDVPLC